MTDQRAEEKTAEGGAPGERLPAIDFATFLLSLSSSALYQLGIVPHPESGETAEPDPLLARQTIDTLEMLRRKTAGNLEPDEEKLFEGLLFELRMRFVELTK